MLDFVTNAFTSLFSFLPFQLFFGLLCLVGLVRLVFRLR